MFSDVFAFIPELCILTVAILLITYGSMNIKITPVPANINAITDNIDKTYCIPVTRLSALSEDDIIRTTSTNAYSLMVVSLLSGCILAILALLLIYEKMRGKSFLPRRFALNRY